MQPLSATTSAFAPDQQFSYEICSWDTPFTVLEQDEASNGIIFDVREPKSDGTWTLKAALRAATAANAAAVFSGDTGSAAVITGGRIANVVIYWDGGAPGVHGALWARKVAYHFRLYPRTTTGRAWFSNASPLVFRLGLGGNGYVRLIKTTAGGTASQVLWDNLASSDINGAITESEFLNDGLRKTDSISLAAGDYLDLYYVQSNETWGGLVVKATTTDLGALDEDEVAAAWREAPVVGCGLFDDNNPPTKRTWTTVSGVELDTSLGASARATIRLPLQNPATSDGLGWEWVKASASDPGVVRNHDGTVFDIKRERLVRIKMGFVGELYTVFTGFVDDFEPGKGEVAITCLSFEQRLLDQFVKNFPDKVSYMAAHYRERSGTSEPVFEIPAYDNWTIEYVIRDLAVRAGVDESRLLRPLQKVLLSTGLPVSVEYGSQTFRKCRTRTMAGTLLRLERATHYGNTGITFNEQEPPDDAYIHKSENTAEIWKQCRDYADRYGFDVRFDETGDLWLQPRNNPHYVQEFVSGMGASPTAGSHPSAYGGTYQSYPDTTGTQTVTTLVRASRIDVSVPRGPSYGTWSFTIRRHSDSAVLAGPTTIDPTHADQEFFYDFRAEVDGTNSTITTLWTGPYDDYDVTLTFVGDNNGTVRFLDSLFLYHTDPTRVLYPQYFATDVNAAAVSAKSSMNDMRNFVIVVGRRRAAVTDSAKLRNNPENPDGEFVVAAATDNGSIALPASTNFVGFPRESVIYDDRITDQDFAEYVARTFIYRQRVPGPSASIEHTLMPVVQLRDPIYAVEAGFNTIDEQALLYVTSIRHRIDGKQAMTTLETTSYPEFPSYEPRQDIDLAAFGDNPVVNVAVSYRSLDDVVMTNLGPGEAHIDTDEYNVVYGRTPVDNVIDMSGEAWPPLPGTVQLSVDPAEQVTGTYGNQTAEMIPIAGVTRTFSIAKLQRIKVSGDGNPYGVIGQWNFYASWDPDAPLVEEGAAFQIPQGNGAVAFYEVDIVNSNITVTIAASKTSSVGRYKLAVSVNYYASDGGDQRYNTNTPYHHLFDVDYRDSNRKIVLKWHQGDDSTPYERTTTTFDVRYRVLGPVDGGGAFDDSYDGACPFYDPYTSELGHLVGVAFDALLTGQYRISVCAMRDSTETVVAWLTDSAADPTNPEAHWQFIPAGAGKTLYWDGVDQVGDWNRRQSDEYAAMMRGAFGEDVETRVGSGFYAWNAEYLAGARGPVALISGQRDATSGRPVFGHGTYGLWYVKFEARNDTVDNAVFRTSQPYPAGADPNTAYNPLTGRVTGTASSGTTGTLVDAGATWSVDQWVGHVVAITAGTNVGSSRTVKSNTADTLTFADVFASAIDGTSAYRIEASGAYVYTHLPEPTKVEILDVKDWCHTAPWTTPDDTDARWEVGTANTDATVNNSKPTRLRFHVCPRPGTLWASHEGEVSVKLTRQAHLRAHIFDMFAQFDGKFYQEHGYQSRRIVVRRLVNDSHTFSWGDDSYRFGSSFKTANGADGLEWVFLPGNCRDNLRGVDNEALVFGDYLQLEEVPGWSQERDGAYSTYILGFINYLFYLSAYAEDRSGRRVWCLNRRFVDKSKILKNTEAHWWDTTNVSDPTTAATSTTYRNDWPDDLTRQQRRTIVVRQWTDSTDEGALTEGTWKADQIAAWGFTGSDIGSLLLRHKWQDHCPASSTINGTAWSGLGLSQDDYSTRLVTQGRLPSVFTSFARQLGSYNAGSPTTVLKGASSTPAWTWEHMSAKTLWIPCITRDWHPYFMLPPMVDRNTDAHHIYEIGVGQADEDDGDAAAAGASTWGGATYDMSQAYGASPYKTLFWPLTAPTGNANNEIGYVRQDELVHYEDLRGMYSRGKRPENAPMRVNPVQPYYVNWFEYSVIEPAASGTAPAYLAKADILNAFRGTFRREYLWESGSLFPAQSQTYMEQPDQMNGALTRYNTYRWRTMVFDTGAWAGWKDDRPVDDENDLGYKLHVEGDASVFKTTWHPLAVGPQLVNNTTPLIFHMVLLNERRAVPAR